MPAADSSLTFLGVNLSRRTEISALSRNAPLAGQYCGLWRMASAWYAAVQDAIPRALRGDAEALHALTAELKERPVLGPFAVQEARRLIGGGAGCERPSRELAARVAEALCCAGVSSRKTLQALLLAVREEADMGLAARPLCDAMALIDWRVQLAVAALFAVRLQAFACSGQGHDDRQRTTELVAEMVEAGAGAAQAAMLRHETAAVGDGGDAAWSECGSESVADAARVLLEQENARLLQLSASVRAVLQALSSAAPGLRGSSDGAEGHLRSPANGEAIGIRGLKLELPHAADAAEEEAVVLSAHWAAFAGEGRAGAGCEDGTGRIKLSGMLDAVCCDAGGIDEAVHVLVALHSAHTWSVPQLALSFIRALSQGRPSGCHTESQTVGRADSGAWVGLLARDGGRLKAVFAALFGRLASRDDVGLGGGGEGGLVRRWSQSMSGLVTAVEDVVARDCRPSDADGAKQLGNRADAAVGLLLEVIEARVQFGRGVTGGVQPENDGRKGVSGELEALSWLLDECRVGEERTGTAGVRVVQGQARCVVLGAVIEWVLVCPTATSAVGGWTLLRTLEVSGCAYGCTQCLPLL